MVAIDYHIPVLLPESVSGLAIKPDGIYVDLTYGGGGHSREILKQIRNGKLIAFDQDPAVKERLISDKRFEFVQHNFRYFANYLKYMGYEQVDGILADLGVSSEHLDNPERGFSFRSDADLDMRMSPGLKQTAADILQQSDEQELKRIFRDYGEVANPQRIARRIVETRDVKPIKSTFSLAECLRPLFPANRENKMMAPVFQALRIAVNQEIESLHEMLEQTASHLKPGGRLAVISYHSLEDRLVKNYIKGGNSEGVIHTDLFGNTMTPFKPLNRKVIVPGPEEIERNSRARSARLRIAERTEYQANV
ncbi:MAG: 16S rRNA (cytosine(1402)-N(4))-methyltransferase RsmH [Porphyromonadaceae bacterium]|nr:MAG: 16S rRNA (cytosine(1402)-N(4))-methyltransferase RsmH [Porphyromonadaceae bacterium]